MNNSIILTLISIIPSIILGIIIYKNDKIEKEPAKLLRKLFLSGILTTVYVIIISYILELIIPFFAIEVTELSSMDRFIYYFLGVALIEEGAKWYMFKKIAWNNKHFDYLYDSIVYAVFISLGFATVENFLYVIEGGLAIGIGRALCSVPGHTFFGVYMGYYFGLAKQAEINNDMKLKVDNILKSILVPTILHTFFNYLLSSSNILISLVYYAFLITLYIKSFKKIKKTGKIQYEMKD